MTHSPPPLPYRGDIDGLRAIAVLSVVLYHFGLPLQGGFTGVDVFFVISGFLIGGILWREYDATGRVALLPFYVRRFKRLAPAFFVMVLVTAVLAWMILLPFEYREFGKTAIAATVYASNILFFRQTGYFDAAAHEKPLLHTWSLAVEEQFYIFLPLLILLLSRSRRALLVALIATWAASLAACLWLTPTQPSAAFYLFPFRAWELLTGVLLAVLGHERRLSWRGHALLSWAGLVLVLAGLALIPAGPQFPGTLALAPVIGTALLLSSGTGRSLVNQALTLPVLRFFGQISYSLYLWHWPVFVLSTYLRDGHAHLFESMLWMGLSVLLAWASWAFVEQPVRKARRLPDWAALAATATASLATLAFGALLFVKDGLPGRFGPDAQPHIAASGDFLQDWSRCHIAQSLPLDGLEVCPIGPEGAPQVLVWGDSHLRAMKEGIDLAAHEAGTPGLIIWRAGCPPLFGLRKVENSATPAQNTACAQANLQIKQSFARLDTVHSVLLVGRWTYYATGQGVGLDRDNTIALHRADGPSATGVPQARLMADAAASTVSEITKGGRRVFVLRQPPEVPMYDSRHAAREAAHSGLPLAADPRTDTEVARTALTPRVAMAETAWPALVDSGQITLLDSWPHFCDAQSCSALNGEVGQYFDNNHVTNAAALRVRELFAPVFARPLALPSRETAQSAVIGE